MVINEIAWAGTKASASDEWLELYNPTSSLVDLTGWKVKSSDTLGPEITLTGSIAVQGLYLIERTNDLPTSQPANLTASFGNGLSNTSCETLSLYNAQDTLIDQMACNTNGSWPGGTATPDFISLERISASTAGVVSNWASNNLLTHNSTDAGSNVVNGTPKAVNSVSLSPTIDPDLRFSEFASVTLTLLGSPYVANTDVTVPAGKTLVVEPGVTTKFKNNVSRFTVNGTLSAVGQSTKPIVFTNDTANTNPWCALAFSPTSVNSVLDYVTVDHAGTTGCGASAYPIFVDGSSITFRNSSITTGAGFRKMYLKNSISSLIDRSTFSGASFNADSAAIYIEGGAPTIQFSTFSSNSIGIYNSSAAAGNPVISSNTFTNNTYPVKLNFPVAVLSGNTATNNTYNGTFLEGPVTQNTTLQADTMPYIMESFTVQAGTLTLQAGVVVKFANVTGGTRELVVNGTLVTTGTSESKVVFTAADDNTVGGTGTSTVATPHWKWIRFLAGGTGNLQNTVVKYGGNNQIQQQRGALSVASGGTLQLQSVEIRNSFFGDNFNNSGLRTDVATTGAVFGSNILFADNKYAMDIAGACPAFSQVTGASFHPDSVPCSF
ncbi:MAG: hypothetical protein Greene041639_122 [Parcubacteria group bacterium Greene0416_39]|nr:MAG: hypothetical protein Greene041639_122 [Parcubacteria group bacterium Greene0416_39]